MTVATIGVAAAQWLTYLGVILAVGAACMSGFVLGRLSPAPWHGLARGRSATIGLVGAAILVLAGAARLLAQAYATFGVDEPLRLRHAGILIAQTPWGRGWLVQVTVALGGVAAFAAWRRTTRVSPPVVGLLAVALALAVPLTGHAAAQARPVLSVAIQAAHVLAGAAWLGTLLVLWLVCFGPRGQKTGESDAMVASLVRAFSPLALAGGAIALGAGFLNGWMYVDALHQLWTTPYGRVLLAKATLAAGAAAVGAYNWRRVRPNLGAPPWTGVVRRSAAGELLIAVLLLAVTAALVGMPFPAE